MKTKLGDLQFQQAPSSARVEICSLKLARGAYTCPGELTPLISSPELRGGAQQASVPEMHIGVAWRVFKSITGDAELSGSGSAAAPGHREFSKLPAGAGHLSSSSTHTWSHPRPHRGEDISDPKGHHPGKINFTSVLPCSAEGQPWNPLKVPRK